jgi:shikimate kinase
MGAGKTTVGRKIAKHLSLNFYDSDLEIESRTGVNIPIIFEYEGEDGFRKRENAMIAELTQLSPIVMATGGGAVLAKENRQFLSKTGFVVYLQCSVNRLLQRTGWDNHRPLLNEGNPRAKIESLMEVRSPLYESCADFIVNTGNQSSRLAAKQIVEVFQSSSNNH